MTSAAQAALARFERALRCCRLCGSRTVCENGLCAYCQDIRLWSHVNRAFCALIHRDRPRATEEAR